MLELKNIVIDHNHLTGVVRAPICRNCNSMLGKIENAATRAKRKRTHLEWLDQAVHYLHTASMPYTYSNAENTRVAEASKRRESEALRKARKAMKESQ